MSKRVCKFYARGACLRGEQCDYSHDRQDTPVDICTFYQKGHCSYGSRCRYKHVKASQARSASSSSNDHQSLASNSVISQTTRGKSRNWRSSAPTSGIDIFKTSNNTVRTCPVCRKLSYFVIPSAIWYSTKEEKQEIIDNYKAKCKLIDCKHFDFGNGNCPFGTSCFYKHTVKPGSEAGRRGRPAPPRRRRANNDMDMYDMMDMLSEFDLQSGEFYSIMRESEFFEDMDPFEIMAVSDMLASPGSGPRFFGEEDSDDEGMGFFQMAALSASLDDPFEDSNNDELNPAHATFLSVMMHSNLEEDSDGDEDD